MIPVKQTKLHDPTGGQRGNCYAACLASILELPIWMVPPFEDMANYWWPNTQRWLKQFFGSTMIEVLSVEAIDIPDFVIGNGPSPRGVSHSVVYSHGKMVHDPHPSNDGLVRLDSYFALIPVPAGEMHPADEAA